MDHPDYSLQDVLAQRLHEHRKTQPPRHSYSSLAVLTASSCLATAPGQWLFTAVRCWGQLRLYHEARVVVYNRLTGCTNRKRDSGYVASLLTAPPLVSSTYHTGSLFCPPSACFYLCSSLRSSSCAKRHCLPGLEFLERGAGSLLPCEALGPTLWIYEASGSIWELLFNSIQL